MKIEMKPGDYRIQVHILEAKDIKAKDKAGGGGFLANFEGATADPMVEVSFLITFHIKLHLNLHKNRSRSSIRLKLLTIRLGSCPLSLTSSCSLSLPNSL